MPGDPDLLAGQEAAGVGELGAVRRAAADQRQPLEVDREQQQDEQQRQALERDIRTTLGRASHGSSLYSSLPPAHGVALVGGEAPASAAGSRSPSSRRLQLQPADVEVEPGPVGAGAGQRPRADRHPLQRGRRSTPRGRRSWPASDVELLDVCRLQRAADLGERAGGAVEQAAERRQAVRRSCRGLSASPDIRSRNWTIRPVSFVVAVADGAQHGVRGCRRRCRSPGRGRRSCW